jgi:DMSO/TMAO reductase YedYZ molybdopterin-dependent catalytic subunit
VTKWSKFDTAWRGVSVDVLLEATEPLSEFVSAWCDGGYTTNLPLADVTDGKAWVAYEYAGEPLEPEHGGPRGCSCRTCTSGRARSGCAGLELTEHDEPGFWEGYGYHNYGDPWREQRYWSD